MQSCLLGVVVVLVIGRAAAADPKAEAKEHLDRATQFHEQHRFGDALQELQAAYTLDPQPDLLYGIAQIDVKIGRCPDAIEFYKRFLATKPNATAAAAAEHWIEVCTTNPPPAEPAEPADDKPTAPPEPAAAIQPPAPRIEIRTRTLVQAPWYSDWLGDTLAVAGLAAGVAGVFEYRAALASIDDANSAMQLSDHLRLVQRASNEREAAVALGAGAGVLVVASFVRFLVHDRTVVDRGVTFAPVPGGSVLAWRSRF